MSRDGSAIPAVVSAASTARPPIRLISRSAAVLSPVEIILAAASSTETLLPSGWSWRSPAPRLLSCAVMVSGWLQLTWPEAMDLASASSR